MLNRRNPEFIKNIWLEMSPFKLIATPIILSIIFLLAYLAGDNNAQSLKFITYISYSLYFVFIFLIGTAKSGYSIVDEVIARTWDSQKMSSTRPYKIIIGKLFGATSFCWYGGLLCLIGYFGSIAAINIDLNRSDFIKDSSLLYQDTSSLIIKILFLILSGILAQIITLFLSLNAISSNKLSSRIRVQVLVSQIISITASHSFFMNAFGISFSSSTNELIWYNVSYGLNNFFLFFLMINIFWFICGCIRLIMKEFQYTLKPYYWTSFVIFCIFYSSGFNVSDKEMLRFFTPMLIVTIMVYTTILATPKEFTSYKKIMVSLKRRDWKTICENIPLWLVSYALIIPTILYAFIEIFIKASTYMHALIVSLTILSILFFITRDILIFYYCSLSRKTNNSTARPLLYLGILYVIIPALLVSFDAGLIYWFIPSATMLSVLNDGKYTSSSITAILLPSLIHLSVITFLLTRKIRNITTHQY